MGYYTDFDLSLTTDDNIKKAIKCQSGYDWNGDFLTAKWYTFIEDLTEVTNRDNFTDIEVVIQCKEEDEVLPYRVLALNGEIREVVPRLVWPDDPPSFLLRTP